MNGAYEEAFNITTEDSLTWREALIDIGHALNKNVIIADIPTHFIIKELREYKGVLLGDKGLNREFNNTKIKKFVPEFNPKIKFKDGIKETINYYNSNPNEKKIDYLWDGKIDRTIEKYYKKNKIRYDKDKLSLKGYNEKLSNKDKIYYTIGRNKILCYTLKILKKVVKK